MKIPIILILVTMASCLGSFADDAASDQQTPQVLARKIATAFQTGHASQIKAEMPADTVILEKGAKDFPSDPLIHFALATCYFAQTNYPACLKSMEKAYTLSQKNPSIGVMYVLALKMNKEPLKAYDLARDMAALHPDVPQLQVQLATLDMTIQKYDEAIAILETLQENAPANLQAQDKSVLLMMLGTCYLYAGDQTKAVEALESALALVPKMVTTYAVLGEAYLKMNETEKAGAALDKILAVNPRSPPALYYKGIYYEKTGNPDMAKIFFADGYANGKRYLQDNGEDYYLMFLLSQKLGKDNEAADYKAEAEKLLYTYEAPWKK